MFRIGKLEKGGGGAAGGGKETETERKVKIVKRDVSPANDSGPKDNFEEGLEGGGAFGLGNIPNKSGTRTEDWEALLTIFPEEIWILILEKIDDPEILETLNNASPALRNLLLPRRVQFLFPKVWNVLEIKYHSQTKSTYKFCRDEAYQEPPTYNSPLPWKQTKTGVVSDVWDSGSDSEDENPSPKWYTGIIKLRMVCRAWRTALDHWYQNQPSNFTLHSGPKSCHTRQYNINHLANDKFVVPEQLKLLMTHFGSTHCEDGVGIKNPFLGRTVYVHLGVEEYYQDYAVHRFAQFRARLLSMFLIYGRFIWHLTIHLQENLTGRVDCYSTIRAMLQAVPNLKKLCIQHTPFGVPRNHLRPIVVSSCQLHRLESYINSHPLPRLEHVQFLTTRNLKPIPGPLFKQLVRTSSHVSILEIGLLSSTLDDYNISSATLPNVKHLSLEIQSTAGFESLLANGSEWRLSKLDLVLDNAVSVEWSRVFKELELKWGETLTTLILRLPIVKGLDETSKLLEHGDNLRLHLPHITSLKLTIPNLCCLDFMLPMRDKLEILNLCVFADVKYDAQSGLVKSLERGKVIQLLRRPHKPMDSNIWTLFPKLKQVVFEYTLCSFSDVRKWKECRADTCWSVSRQMWRDWAEKCHNYRREKMEEWSIERAHFY